MCSLTSRQSDRLENDLLQIRAVAQIGQTAQHLIHIPVVKQQQQIHQTAKKGKERGHG
jgi:hypothetical protein